MRKAIARAKRLAKQTGTDYCVAYNTVDKCYVVRDAIDRYEYIVAVISPDGMVIHHEASI